MIQGVCRGEGGGGFPSPKEREKEKRGSVESLVVCNATKIKRNNKGKKWFKKKVSLNFLDLLAVLKRMTQKNLCCQTN